VITEGYYARLWCEDDDWYVINTEAGNTLTVDLSFLDSKGNIDLGLFDDLGDLQIYSESTTDNERISVEIDSTGVVYIAVFYLDDPNSYDLTIVNTATTNTTDTADTDTSFNSGDISSFSGVSFGLFAILGIVAVMFQKQPKLGKQKR